MLTQWIIRRIPDYENVKDERVRSAYGKAASLVGIGCNVLLFAGKLVAGLLSSSVAIMADAVNNLSDASSSLISLLGFKRAVAWHEALGVTWLVLFAFFVFGVGCSAAHLQRGGNDGVAFTTYDQLDTGGQRQLRDVHRMTGIQGREVDLDEFRQVARQAHDVDVVDDGRNDAATELDGRAVVTADEVQRHLDVNLLVGCDALEVDVQHLLLEGMPLGVTQDDGFLLAVDFDAEQGGVENFLLQQVVQLVVVERDRLGVLGAAVDDARQLAGTTLAAARTRTLSVTLGGPELNLHGVAPGDVSLRPRPDENGKNPQPRMKRAAGRKLIP